MMLSKFQVFILILLGANSCVLFYLGSKRQYEIHPFPSPREAVRNYHAIVKKTSSIKIINDLLRHTSPSNTTIEVRQLPSNDVPFEAVIVARDGMNQTKQYGGDFFRVFLTKVDQPQDGVTCDVIDFNNGTYLVTAPPLFNWKMMLQAQLVHSSEVIALLKQKTSSIRQPLNDIVTFIANSTGGIEQTFCNVDLRPDYNYSQSCNYTTLKREDNWYCVKPSSGECGKIQSNFGAVRGRKSFLNTNESKLFKASFFVDISGSKQIFQSSISNPTTVLPPCFNFPDTFRALAKGPAGYYDKGRWNSLICSNTENFVTFPKLFEECLRNKVLYMFGDSTSRQWFEYFELKLNITVNAKDKKAAMPPRVGKFKNTNGVIYLHGHGEPFRTKGNSSYTQYIMKLFNDIQDKSVENIVIISIGLHFLRNSPTTFKIRIMNIKEGLLSLLARLPSTKVYFRDISMHIATGTCPSPWLSHRLNMIVRNEFRGINNVYHLNTWGMTSQHISHDVHPGVGMVEEQIALFQSFICK